jgi:triacylglycerol esterase/lipase EstA (alpha/beta hydrolase family)
MRPIIVVHGIWDSERSVAPLVRGLAQRGHREVHALSLTPAWGNAPIETLAEQLARFVGQVKARHAAEHVDVVGFSMGALVTRAYLQLLAGAAHVRTFVSISGPHRGTWTAYGLPLAGVRQMRPGSALLAKLGSDVSHLGGVAVHCLYTPYDAMIVPSESSVLSGARSVHRVPVLVHKLMLHDARVHALTARLLQEGALAPTAG